MDIRILGISGSPVKDGNVETLLDKMLAGVEKKTGVTVEAVRLSRLDVRDCIHCNFCVKKQKPGKYCSIDDDAQAIFEKAEAADILVLATPVYFLRTSGRMASLLDRLRVFVFGNLTAGKMKNKVGVSAAVAWARNGGFETAHLTHIFEFMTLEMIPVSVHHCISPLGASAVASPQGSGVFVKDVRLGIENDPMGLHSASAMMNRALELSTLLKRGAEK
jgi:multimeric flavodoxin WrbA